MTFSQWAGFFALCLLWASAWLVEDLWPAAPPSELPEPARQCLHSLVMALVAGLLGFRRTARNPLRTRPWARLAFGGVCLLALPAMLVEYARRGVSTLTVSELFALLPVAVVVLVPYLDTGEIDTGRLLAPSMMGLAGVLLLLPFALPGTWQRAGCEAVVLLAVAMAAIAGIRMHRLLAAFTVSEAVLVCCLANAGLSFAWLLVTGLAPDGAIPLRTIASNWRVLPVEAATAAVYDLPQLILLLWLMREVSPVRLAVRYWVVPLLTVLEGYTLLRTGLTARMVAGAGLVVFAAWRLMTARAQAEEPRLMLH